MAADRPTADRDPAIAELLDHLDVAAPGRAFWVDLEARLAEVTDLALVPDPTTDGRALLELRPIPARPPASVLRRRRAVTGLAAAAVLAVAALAIQRSGEVHERVVPGDPTSSTAPTSTAPTSTVAPVVRAARAWLGAVAQGPAGADAAWALLGPQSRGSVDRAAFDQLVAGGALRETWRAADPDAAIAALPLSSADDVWILLLPTTPASSDVLTLAVRRTGETGRVEPFVPGPALELISFPMTGGVPSVAAGATVTVHVDADAAASVVAVDGAAVTGPELVRARDGAIVGVRTTGLAAGDHTITVATQQVDGTLAVDTRTFSVRG